MLKGTVPDPVKKIKAFLVATLAVIYDQIYHIFLNAPHNIITQLPNSAETAIYIGSKFAIVFVTYYIAKTLFRRLPPGAYAVGVGALAALIFGGLLSFLFPTSYTYWIHVFHALAIGLAVYMVESKMLMI